MILEYEVSLLIAIAVLLLTVFYTLKYSGKNVNTAIRILGGGVLIASFVLFCSLENAPKSFFSSLQAATLDASYGDILDSISGKGNGLYKILFVTICIISPVMLGGFISTLAEGLWDRITYLILKNFRTVYYFSELNKKSLMLASDIRRKSEKAIIVFCNFDKNTDIRYKTAAEDIDAYFLTESENAFVINTKHKKYYFEISENHDLNLENAKQLINLYADKPGQNKNIEIYLFSDKAEAEIVMNSTDKKDITVNIINEKKLIAYDLVFQKPLYENIKNNTMSVLIIGSDPVAFEVLKAASWCGQLGDEYELKINYIDKNASYYKSVLKKECPELICSNYNIKFFDCDTDTDELEKTVLQYCSDTTYIVLADENDEKNIQNALFFRSLFMRTSPDFNNEPVIAAFINDTIKYNMCKEFTAVSRERIERKGWNFSDKKAQNYNIYPFGADQYVYSDDFMINSDIEKLAVNCHAVYELAFSKNTADDNEIRSSYNVSETNKRSSRANAIRIKYKLFLCGMNMCKCTKPGDITYDDIKAILTEKTMMDKLSRVEHECWNAFMRSEGYRGASVDEARIYQAYTNNHKNIRAKLHACICDWDELDRVSAEFDPLFKKYDRDFIEKIPEILGMLPDSKVNICGVSYSICKNN